MLHCYYEQCTRQRDGLCSDPSIAWGGTPIKCVRYSTDPGPNPCPDCPAKDAKIAALTADLKRLGEKVVALSRRDFAVTRALADLEALVVFPLRIDDCPRHTSYSLVDSAGEALLVSVANSEPTEGVRLLVALANAEHAAQKEADK